MKSIKKERKKVLNNTNLKDIKANIIPNKFKIGIENSRGYNLKTLENTKSSDKKYSNNNMLKSYY